MTIEMINFSVCISQRLVAIHCVLQRYFTLTCNSTGGPAILDVRDNSVPTTADRAHEMVEHGEQNDHEYELIEVCPTPPLVLQPTRLHVPLQPLSYVLQNHCVWLHPLVGMWVWSGKERKRVHNIYNVDLSDHMTFNMD